MSESIEERAVRLAASIVERAERLAASIVPEGGGSDRVIVMVCDGVIYCRETAREAIAREIIDHYTAEDGDDAVRESIREAWWPIGDAFGAVGEAFPHCSCSYGDRGHLVCGSCGADIDRGTPAGTYNGPGVECYNCRATGIYVDGVGYVRDDHAELVAEIPFYPRDGSEVTYVTVPVIGDRGMTDHAVYVLPGAENGPIGAAFPAVYVVRTDVVPRGPRWQTEHDHLTWKLYESDLRYPGGSGVDGARAYVDDNAVRMALKSDGVEYRIVDK